jgi:hypothetical protein
VVDRGTPFVAPLPGYSPEPLAQLTAAAAREAWALLAPRIAGQLRMRESRDGRTYPQRWEVPLTAAPPRLPAAVRLYGRDGTARCLAADLDVARAGRGQVEADAAALAELVAGCGGRTVADLSPSGGRHVYLLLAEPVPYAEMRRAALALAALLPSLDATPLLNLTAGCIRPPGATHKTGGAQQLVTPWPAARAAAATPNPPTVWARLLDALGSQLTAVDAEPAGWADPAEPERPGLPGRLSVRMAAIARTGVHAYRSGSEARQAVLTAAAGAGWQLGDVARHVETGAWPGLASLYARYGRRNGRAALARDWRKAAAFVTRQKTVHNCHTSQPPSHPGVGNDHQFVRAWRNALAAVEPDRYGESRGGLGKRMLLRSLATAAHLRGSRYVEFGCRSLSLAAGMDHGTVARHLRELDAEPDPLIRCLERRRGVRGDLYELVLPAAAERTAATRAWPAGKVHALRPAFRELGAPAALTYEALEQTRCPLSRFTVATTARLSPAAAADALRILAAFGLAQRGRGGWRLGPTSPQSVAEVLGVPEVLHQLQQRYAVERAAWREKLAAWRGDVRLLRRAIRAPDRAPRHAGAPGPAPPPVEDQIPLQRLGARLRTLIDGRNRRERR